MARKRKKKSRGGRRKARRGARSQAAASATQKASSAEVKAGSAEPSGGGPKRDPEPPAEESKPVEVRAEPPVTAAPEASPKPQPAAGEPPASSGDAQEGDRSTSSDPALSGAEPTERMPVSPLAVTLPDVSEGAVETSGELWSSNRRPPEPELPAVEIHPENPDAAPVVSGVIQGFEAPKDSETRASSALAVDFGDAAEPSIQIDDSYRQDTLSLQDGPAPQSGSPAEEEDHKLETPSEPLSPAESATPELSGSPFEGDTDKVDTTPTHPTEAPVEGQSGDRVKPTKGSASLVEAGEVEDLQEGESLPVYAVDGSGGSLIEVAPEQEDGPAPTKRTSILRPPEPAAHEHGREAPPPLSPFPPAEDPRVKEPSKVVSDAGAYSAPSGEPDAPVAVARFRPAAFVPTTGAEPEADRQGSGVPPKASRVPPLHLPPKDAPEQKQERSPEKSVPGASEAAGVKVVSGIIGGAAVTPKAPEKDGRREGLTASGNIIVDPNLLQPETTESKGAGAEEPQPKETKAEEPQAEETKAEETKAEPTPQREQPPSPAPEKKDSLEGGNPSSPGPSIAATVRYELSEALADPAPKRPEPPRSAPPGPARPNTPAPLSKAEAFSELEIAFFEQDLQKVEEVDTFEDLVQDLPEPETPWGRLFGKPRGKPRPRKRPEPSQGASANGKPKKVPRPPGKRK